MPFNNINRHPKERGSSSFEFYFVIALIGLVILLGVERYITMTREVKIEKFYLMVNQFRSAVALANVNWNLRRSSYDMFTNKYIVYSVRGWPVDIITKNSADGSHNTVVLNELHSPEFCARLWSGFLSVPLPTVEGEAIQKDQMVHAKLVSASQCRFVLRVDSEQEIGFDYFIESGRVERFSAP